MTLIKAFNHIFLIKAIALYNILLYLARFSHGNLLLAIMLKVLTFANYSVIMKI